MHKEVVELRCAYQNYDWGKVGHDSLVAQLKRVDPSFQLDPELPYAELWMGCHPRGESLVVCSASGTSQKLSQFLVMLDKEHTRGVIRDVPRLPFLFKVLSIRKCLSIQVHPAKSVAKDLHHTLPHVYPDSNHKPELAVALTQFECLCGFQTAPSIINYFHEVPELLELVGQKAVDDLVKASLTTGPSQGTLVKKALHQCFADVMTADMVDVGRTLRRLHRRLREELEIGQDTSKSLGHLFLKIYDQFPGDVGCLAIYFLNYVVLEEGEAVFIRPGVPHSYISGDCIECMACSDNVVRAGLTPKLKDVRTLFQIVDCSPSSMADIRVNPSEDPSTPSLVHYRPAVDEFEVARIQINQPVLDMTIPAVRGLSLYICIHGSAEVRVPVSSTGTLVELQTLPITKGSVFLCGPDTPLLLNVQSSLTLYRSCQSTTFGNIKTSDCEATSP